MQGQDKLPLINPLASQHIRKLRDTQDHLTLQQLWKMKVEYFVFK